MIKRFQLLAVALLAVMLIPTAVGQAQGATTTITVIGFSDYHSHAVPFYSEGQPNQGGVARTIAYLKTMRQSTPNLLVLSGGDTMNKGTPTWSDEYKCTEWPWFNGLIDVMAIGNHDFDYGQDVLKGCQQSANYPILSANYVYTDGTPVLTSDGKPYMVKVVGGVKVGMFALAGTDFPKLVKPENMAPGSSFADRVTTAKQIVATLRDTEKVSVVILFGHALREDDAALAQAVPGIDVVLGTHSHYKGEWAKIPNTETYIISPFQYLAYLSQVQLTFTDGKLTAANGQLVKMDAAKPEDPDIAAKVAQMQKDLEAKHPDRFAVLGNAAVEMSVDGVDNNETVLGNWSMETVRSKVGTSAFFSTASSFRATIPPGPITVEAFFTAIPYKNSVVTADMTGQQLGDLLNLDVSKLDSDSFLQESGVRFTMQGGKATDVQVLTDPSNPNSFAPLDPAKTYKVGVTNFMSGVAAGYKDMFASGAANVTDTKMDIGNILTTTIQTASPISAALDGRMGIAPAANPTPGSGMTMPGGGSATPTPPSVISVPAMPTPAMMATTPTPAKMPALPHTGGDDGATWWWLLAVALVVLLGGAFLTTATRQPRT